MVAPADCWNWGKRGLMEYKWKGSFLGWFVGLGRAGTLDFYPALAALVSPVQNICFLTSSLYLSPSHTNLDRQSCRVASLLVCTVSLMEINEKCMARKKIFCTWPIRAAKAGQRSLVTARRVHWTNQGRIPFIYTPWVPICLIIQQSAGAT